MDNLQGLCGTKMMMHFPHSMQANKQGLQQTIDKEQTRLLSWISTVNEVSLKGRYNSQICTDICLHF